jgi:hypothetical protein
MGSYVKESTLERIIQKQVRTWEQFKKASAETPSEPRPFITISREYGCNANAIASFVADELNRYQHSDLWKSYDKDLINKIVEDHNISEKLIETIDTKRREEMSELMRSLVTDYPPQVAVYKKLVETVRSLSIHGKAIIVGRAGVVITRDLHYGVHVKFIAPLSFRVNTIMQLNSIKDRLEAERLIAKKDNERNDFLTQYIKFDSVNPVSYDLTINIARFSEKEIAGVLIGMLKARGYLQ